MLFPCTLEIFPVVSFLSCFLGFDDRMTCTGNILAGSIRNLSVSDKGNFVETFPWQWFFLAMFYLFVCLTQDGWVEIFKGFQVEPSGKKKRVAVYLAVLLNRCWQRTGLLLPRLLFRFWPTHLVIISLTTFYLLQKFNMAAKHSAKDTRGVCFDVYPFLVHFFCMEAANQRILRSLRNGVDDATAARTWFCTLCCF